MRKFIHLLVSMAYIAVLKTMSDEYLYYYGFCILFCVYGWHSLTLLFENQNQILLLREKEDDDDDEKRCVIKIF